MKDVGDLRQEAGLDGYTTSNNHMPVAESYASTHAQNWGPRNVFEDVGVLGALATR